jgi:drug/metabolite transporter (DMT)-like permease
MKKWQRRAALVFFVVAAAAAVKAFDIGFGSFGAPGPGFFPFWLAVLMAAVAAGYYAVNRGDDGEAPRARAKGWYKRPAVAVAVMLLYVQALEYLGFATATFFLFAAWLRGVEGERWRLVGLVAVIGTAAMYVLFAVLLHLAVPRGLLI